MIVGWFERHKGELFNCILESDDESQIFLIIEKIYAINFGAFGFIYKIRGIKPAKRMPID